MPHIFVLIGASGVGKTTVARARKVVKQSENLIMPVGVTTRKPRTGENQGVDYRFISPKTFQQWEQEGAFIETVYHNDHSYGLLKENINTPLSKEYDLLLILTAQGLNAFEKLFPQTVVSIFISPPSIAELKLRRHKQDNWKTLTQEDDIFGKNRSYNFKIINDNLGITIQRIQLVRKIVKRGKS